MNIQLRPASSEDAEFLYRVYCTTREQEMAMVPWTHEQREAFLRMQFAAQQSDYSKRFPDARQTIIVADDVDVGRFHTVEVNDEIKILDITVLPNHRGNGIGSFIIREVQTNAQRSDKRVVIYVESFNPSVSFFEKRGFEKIENAGIYFLLECCASSPKNTATPD
jgi:ribosomal protein S18 acetylase RimI-like enzyme